MSDVRPITTEGAMQRQLDAALEHANSLWGQLTRAGIVQQTKTWPPRTADHGDSKIGYTLAAFITYVHNVESAMRKMWGDIDGQLCPYEDCAHDLAIPFEGWYTCGHCLKDFWCAASDGIEDYHCYLPDEGVTEQPPKPDSVPIARDLGASWSTPSAGDKDE